MSEGTSVGVMGLISGDERSEARREERVEKSELTDDESKGRKRRKENQQPSPSPSPNQTHQTQPYPSQASSAD